MMLHLQSVRLAIPARVVMGTWGISPFMLKMRSRGRVNAQAAQYHQSLPIPHISKMLQRQKNRYCQQGMDAITCSVVRDVITRIKKQPYISWITTVFFQDGGLKTVSAHECALLHCQHNCTSDVDSLYRPYSTPRHAYTNYWFITASGAQIIFFPASFPSPHLQFMHFFSCGISTCSSRTWNRCRNIKPTMLALIQCRAAQVDPAGDTFNVS